MKHMLFLTLITLITLTSSQLVPFIQQDFDMTKNQKCDKREEMETFLESLFSHFGLDKPCQIIECFNQNEVDSGLFFGSLWAVNKLLKDSAERKSFAAHVDSVKLELLGSSLHSTFACVMMSQDFTDLLDALDIKERNPKAFSWFIYLYYQSYYPELAEDFSPLIGSLKNKDFTAAGDVFGSILGEMVESIKEDGCAYEGFSAFSNGAATELGLDFPQDSVECHDSDSAGRILEFLYELSQFVSNGKLKEAPLNALNFWHQRGKKILEDIPKDIVKCYIGSEDIGKLGKKLGIRVSSPAFVELLKRYINNRRTSFYAYMKSINRSFEDGNLVHAGYFWGHFLDSLSNFLPYAEEKVERVES